MHARAHTHEQVLPKTEEAKTMKGYMVNSLEEIYILWTNIMMSLIMIVFIDHVVILSILSQSTAIIDRELLIVDWKSWSSLLQKCLSIFSPLHQSKNTQLYADCQLNLN